MISIRALLTKMLTHTAEVDTSLATVTTKTNNMIYRATCTTAAGTTAKVASFTGSPDFTLAAGVCVLVTFTYGNTATTPTLNVAGTGAKTIGIPYGATSGITTGSGTTVNTWGPRESILFTYNGSYWLHEPSSVLAVMTHSGLSQKADASAVEIIGTTESASNSAAVSMTSETGTAMTSITLPAGTWVVVGKVRFSSNASGARRLNISTTSGATTIQVSGAPASGTTTDMQITRILTPTSSTTYYLNAYQSSGSTLSCVAGQATLDAIRIK